jgi:hypothetical protein
MSIVDVLQKTDTVTENLARRFTPTLSRNRNNMLGKIFLYLIAMGLYSPLIVIYYRRGDILRSYLLFAFLSVVILSSILLVPYGKKAAIKVLENLEIFLPMDRLDILATQIRSSLSITKQILSGGIFSLIAILLAHLANTFRYSGLAVYASVSLSVILTAFFVGSGLYLVLCIPKIYSELIISKFDIPTLLPYQTMEFRRVANISASLSLVGAIISTSISFLIMGFFVTEKTQVQTAWLIIMIGVFILSWITISIPFIASQRLLSQIIIQAKEENLLRLRTSIDKARKQLSNINSDKKLVDIEKIQALYDKIYSSPNTILDWSMTGKFISSLLLSLLPSIIGILLSR